MAENGFMVFIISDSYNSAKYAKKSHEFFIGNSKIERIDFCSEISLFNASVFNTIVLFSKKRIPEEHKPIRINRRGDEIQDFFHKSELLETGNQKDLGPGVFLRGKDQVKINLKKYNELNDIVYISYGLRPNAKASKWKGEFKTKDVLSDCPDDNHPKKVLQGKDITKWSNTSTQYLEWGTDRAPRKFARSTFQELYEVPEKLIAVKVSKIPEVAYDDSHHFHTDGAISFVPWHYLKGIKNRSIDKTAKYSISDSGGDRKGKEVISSKYNLKYILAIMNSSFTIDWLKSLRRHKLQLYPNDWKKLPIPNLTIEEQSPFIEIVEKLIFLRKKYGKSLPAEESSYMDQLEDELNHLVSNLYKE